MRWTPGGISRDIEDRRGGGGFPGGGRGVGAGGFLVLLVLSFIFGRDLITPFLGGAGSPVASSGRPVEETAEEREKVKLVSFVLDDAQDTWTKLFSGMRQEYQRARLVLFRDAVQSACGFAESATGPFYCPGDQRVYIDLGFFDDLERRFRAPGDFAQAYVLAHEVGHHVQRLLGIERRVRSAQQSNPGSANQLSVRMELQADCFAGVWGHAAAQRGHLETGDVEEGLAAASSIGDDRIQRMSGRAVSPESFTHGSSAQRVEWFRRGLQSGDPSACDTFGGSDSRGRR